jgi:DNA-binding winged helix-turn-helix (wHTH) protein
VNPFRSFPLRLLFGDCVFDGTARLLSRAGAPQDLSPKAFELLAALLAGRPKAFSKQELHDLVWPDSFVSASSLARLVNEVRTAIGDDAKDPTLVRTVHGYGYAFAGEVTEQGSASAWGVLTWAGQTFPLMGADAVIGRDPDCSVRLDLKRVSRRHARVFAVSGRAFVEDLGSKNGTHVRGKKVDGKVTLNPGDEIVVGPAVLVYSPPASPGSTETDVRPPARRRR